MGFPAEGFEGLYRNPLRSVQQLLKSEHGGHYCVYNLCAERTYKDDKFEVIKNFPIEDHNAPPLAMMEAFCLALDEWLERDPDNVAVVHCKAGKGLFPSIFFFAVT